MHRVEKGSSRLEVHHIVPFRLSHDNSENNLIPLCSRCHKKIEFTTVEVESTGLSVDEMFVINSLFLRKRQAETRQVLTNLLEKIKNG